MLRNTRGGGVVADAAKAVPRKDITVYDSLHPNGRPVKEAKPKAAKEADSEPESAKPRKGRFAPNSTYKRNGYTYTTDEHGRIKSVEGQLKLDAAERNKYAQRTVGLGDGRLPDDQGGHLIGSQFGGYGGKENLTPMAKEINDYHSGEWGSMEKSWAKALDEGKTVEVKIEPIYTDETARASSFRVTQTIDGIPREKVIINPQ